MATKEQPQVAAPQPVLAKGRGVVKSVLSGDTLIITDIDKASSSGPPPERQITFSSLSAPRLAHPKTDTREATDDEPFAWDSREFLRKKCIGKKVIYSVEYVNPAGREYGIVYLVDSNNEPLNNLVVAEGWAALFKSNTGKESKRPDAIALAQLEEAAQLAKKGIFSDIVDTAVRPTPKFDTILLCTQLKNKPVKAIVEQARSGSTVRVTILPSFHNLIVLLSGVQAPSLNSRKGDTQEPEPFARESKFFIEQNVLQRDVTLNIEGSDKQGNFFGSIECQGRDVAEELLKNGLASYVAWSATLRGPALALKLKNAEKSAKDAKKRMWINYVEKHDGPSSGGTPKEFVGRCTGVLNAGSITVAIDGVAGDKTINFSSIKVPRASYPGDEAHEAEGENKEEVRAEKAWGAEAKEFLRKRLVGQKVKVIFDYTRKVPKKENTADKSYYTVYLDKVNIAVLLADQGFVKVTEHKAGDDRSNDYELLLLAENKARSAGKGWHGTPDKAPTRRFNDLTIESNDNKARQAQIAKAKAFLPFLTRTGPHKAVVDYVFSGGRYKVSVPGQSCVITLSLSGVKVPKRFESTENDAISDEALQWARSKLHQREVSIEVEAVDKGGNFLGEVFPSKDTNFSVQLVAEGFATVHMPTAERMRNGKALIEAEEKAKKSKKHIWKHYDAEEEKRKQQLQAAAEAGAEGGTGPGSAQEYHEVIVTEVLKGDRFYVQIISPETAHLDELVATLTELSLEEGPVVVELDHRVNDIVRAQFTEDDSWYRAKVLRVLPDRKYEVVYHDYGNREIIPASRIRVLPHGLNNLPVQAQEAGLAFIKAPSLDSEWGRESQLTLKEFTAGKRLLASVEYRDGGVMYFVLLDREAGVYINTAMIRTAVARVSRKVRRAFNNPVYKALKEEEEKAKAAHVGIWQYGDAPDSDEDEDEPRGAWGKPAAPSAAGAKGAPGVAGAKGAPAAAAGAPAAGGRKK